MEHIFDNICTELEYGEDPIAFNKKLNGQPAFIGQGGSKSVGSDRYGYFLVEKKTLSNGKTIWGYSSAKVHMLTDWTEGTEVCEGPCSWKAKQWIIARGFKKYRGKKLNVPQWWHCDENGNRIAGSKCDIDWSGAKSWKDPNF